MADSVTADNVTDGNSNSTSHDSYVLVSDSDASHSSDCSTSDYYSDATSDEEHDDIFPSPPPSNAMANDTPVRSRVDSVPSPRWSSPTASTSNVGAEVSGSYHELANRPRSNPRVRTPMRNVSPFLGTVNRSTVANEGDDRVEAANGANGEGASGRAQLALGAGLAVGTVLREGDLALRQQRTKSQRSAATRSGSLSDKQGPSHRKLRRWNNDKFVGIASEISRANPTSRGTKIANVYTEADADRSRYVMPHDPPEYRSHFTTLLATGAEEGHDPDHIDEVRRRFLRGDVSDPGRKEMTDGARDRLRKKEDDIFNDGTLMVRVKVQERLLNVVRRACQSSPFSRNVLSAFERELVRHLSADVGPGPASGDGESILEEVLVQKSMVTRKARSTTLRFLFGNENHDAFNRILLHGVSHFHGLNTSSTTTSKGHRLLTVTGTCRGCQFKLVDFLDLTEELPMDGDRATMYDKDPVVVAPVSSLKVS